MRRKEEEERRKQEEVIIEEQKTKASRSVAEDETTIKNLDAGHSPDQGEIEGSFRDHDIPLGEESSVGVIDLDLPSTNLTSLEP